MVASTIDDDEKLENVQRRFAKRINSLSCLSYEDRLVHLKVDSLRYRRILCYTIINSLVAMNCSDFFSFNNVRTRGHNLNYSMQFSPHLQFFAT